MEPAVLIMLVLSSLAFCAAIGGCVSYWKNRQPLEGCLLGVVLGPIGLILAFRMPFLHRPMVDRGAWHTFRSMVELQSDSHLMHLPVENSRPTQARAHFGGPPRRI